MMSLIYWYMDQKINEAHPQIYMQTSIYGGLEGGNERANGTKNKRVIV